jgi:ElaB/YqjD/DUF883 family membrane-anchored ribosome-binding protein
VIKLEEMLVVRESRITIIENQAENQYNDFTKRLNIESEKQKVQAEIIDHLQKVANSHKEENEHLKKKVRRLKWQRIGLGALIVVVVGISL